jgi:hypothetical protein
MRLEVPQSSLSRSAPPAVLPANVIAPRIPSVALTPAFDEEKVEQLRRLQQTSLPGNILVAIGFPLLFGIPLLFMCLFSMILVNGSDGNSLLSGSLCFVVVFLWTGGSFCLVLVRKKLNTDFVQKNTIRLDYSMPQDKDLRYKRLLYCIDEVAPAKMFEIVASKDGVYEETTKASLCVTLPRFLDCNYDVYCLCLGRDKYYLLPECILVFTAGEVFTVQYGKVSLAIDNINGSLRNTVYDYHWAHARVDGGPDRRYKNNYQIAVPRKITVPLHHYGIMSFKIGRDKFIILTDRASPLPAFDAAFQNWLHIQQ